MPNAPLVCFRHGEVDQGRTEDHLPARGTGRTVVGGWLHAALQASGHDGRPGEGSRSQATSRWHARHSRYKLGGFTLWWGTSLDMLVDPEARESSYQPLIRLTHQERTRGGARGGTSLSGGTLCIFHHDFDQTVYLSALFDENKWSNFTRVPDGCILELF